MAHQLGVGEVDADLHVGDRPATAVEVHQQWKWRLARGRVHAHPERKLPARAGDEVILHFRDRLGLAFQVLEREARLACLGHRHLVERRHALRLHLLEQNLSLRIQWHGTLLAHPGPRASGGPASPSRDLPDRAQRDYPALA